MPDTPWWLSYSQKPGFDNSKSSIGVTGPAYDRVTALPDFMPKIGGITSELADQYSKTPAAFDTTEFDAASKDNQSRVLTTALNAGNNAATEYANRARQSGGSELGAGLVKAEAGVGARATAGDMEMKRLQFDAVQREKAASQATQIASTLATLRDSYLKSLVDYATKEDATSAEYKSKMAAIAAQNYATDSSAKPRGSWVATVPNNMGLASGLDPFAGNPSTGQYTGAPAGWRPGQPWNFGGGG